MTQVRIEAQKKVTKAVMQKFGRGYWQDPVDNHVVLTTLERLLAGFRRGTTPDVGRVYTECVYNRFGIPPGMYQVKQSQVVVTPDGWIAVESPSIATFWNTWRKIYNGEIGKNHRSKYK